MSGQNFTGPLVKVVCPPLDQLVPQFNHMQISSWARRDLRDFQRVALSGLSGKTLQAAVPTNLFASSDIKKQMPKFCSLRQWNSESENSIMTD